MKKPGSCIDDYRGVCEKNITCALRLNNHVYKEKENVKHLDSLLDCEIDPYY